MAAIGGARVEKKLRERDGGRAMWGCRSPGARSPVGGGGGGGGRGPAAVAHGLGRLGLRPGRSEMFFLINFAEEKS